MAVFVLNWLIGLIGIACLLRNPSSKTGHVFLNLFLFSFLALPSTLIHEYAHAVIGKLAGLTVLRIWVGRGKTLYRVRLLGFDTEFKAVPIGGLTFLTHGFKEKLRFRYFLAILAGPLTNAIIFIIAYKFASWRNFDLETFVYFWEIVALTQAVILIGNLLPYRMRTAVGIAPSDGLWLIQLLRSKSFGISNFRG